jgi:hypothetical protein
MDGTDASRYENFVHRRPDIGNEFVYLVPDGWQATTAAQRMERRPFICEWAE